MKECPKCTGAMVEQEIDPRTKVRFCEKCRGIWLSKGQLARSVGKPSDWPAIEEAKARGKPSRYLCTDCGRSGLVAFGFRPPDPLEVDFCPSCEGIFLDFKEFSRAQELIRREPTAVPSRPPMGGVDTGRVVPTVGNIEAARNDYLLGDHPVIPAHLLLKNETNTRIWRRAIALYREDHSQLYPRWRKRIFQDFWNFNPSIRNEFFFYQVIWRFTPFVKPPQYQPLHVRFLVLGCGLSALLVGLYTIVNTACVVPGSGSLYQALANSRSGGTKRRMALTGYPVLDLAILTVGVLAWGYMGEQRNALPPWAWYLAKAEKIES